MYSKWKMIKWKDSATDEQTKVEALSLLENLVRATMLPATSISDCCWWYRSCTNIFFMQPGWLNCCVNGSQLRSCGETYGAANVTVPVTSNLLAAGNRARWTVYVTKATESPIIGQLFWLFLRSVSSDRGSMAQSQSVGIRRLTLLPFTGSAAWWVDLTPYQLN